MLRYSRYITFTFIKKLSPWIVLLSGIVAYFAITTVSINSANHDLNSYVTSISTFDKFFPFLFAVLMSVFGIIHVFKDGEEDGSELTIISKPLLRSQIIISKFLMIMSLIILYQVIMFIVYIAAAFMDDFASTSQRMQYATSLFVGGIIVQTIMTAVVILLASLLSKVGTLVVGIILSAAFPVLSFSIAPTTGGQPFNIVGFENTRGQLEFSGNDGQVFNQNTDDIYFEPYPTADTPVDPDLVPSDGDSIFWNSVRDYEGTQAYGALAYLDLWYQWGRFYDIFVPQNSSSSAVVQKWERVTRTISADEINSINVGNDSYVIMMRNSPFGDGDIINQNTINSTINKFQSWYATPSNKIFFDDKSLFGRIQIIRLIETSGTIDLNKNDGQLVSDLGSEMYKSFNYLVEYNLLANKGIINDDARVIGLSQYDQDLPIPNLVRVGYDYVTLDNKPWIPTSVVIAIWSVLGVLLVAGATWIYFKRDFK